MRTAVWVLSFFFFGFSLSAQHINGLTVVAAPRPFVTDPYPRIADTKANWVCLVPYGFTRPGETSVIYDMERQWWGEKIEGLIENIKLAKKAGFQVFLKPQIYFPGSWPGDHDLDSAGWSQWEENYTTFIMAYLEVAIEYDVDMFCIGTEFKISVAERSTYWKGLIEKARCLYAGKITYSSNWDNYQNVPFWEALDYIGISSYFPLVEKDVPTPKQLKKAWSPIIKELSKFSASKQKKILFSEYGYLSVDGCTGKTWELENKVKQLPINELAQATAFNALYENLWPEAFWAGGFIWKWFPNGQGHEGYVTRDYTPQDKEAERVLIKWFGKEK